MLPMQFSVLGPLSITTEDGERVELPDGKRIAHARVGEGQRIVVVPAWITSLASSRRVETRARRSSTGWLTATR